MERMEGQEEREGGWTPRFLKDGCAPAHKNIKYKINMPTFTAASF